MRDSRFDRKKQLFPFMIPPPLFYFSTFHGVEEESLTPFVMFVLVFDDLAYFALMSIPNVSCSININLRLFKNILGSLQKLRDFSFLSLFQRSEYIAFVPSLSRRVAWSLRSQGLVGGLGFTLAYATLPPPLPPSQPVAQFRFSSLGGIAAGCLSFSLWWILMRRFFLSPGS